MPRRHLPRADGPRAPPDRRHGPCAGPCSSSWLADPRTGQRLGAVGGGFNTSELDPVLVKGNVWAFNDADLSGKVDRFAFQDIKTGRIVHRFERPASCADGSGDDVGCGVPHDPRGRRRRAARHRPQRGRPHAPRRARHDRRAAPHTDLQAMIRITTSPAVPRQVIGASVVVVERSR
ncbi:MAG TPA: hypothetical protein VN253_17270 [Kofleriaceae bacterium]|nr:hypothetical protein [Kofleriaceae bacterium]